jgi:hypothetical protein
LEVVAKDEWRARGLYEALKNDAIRVLYRVYESKCLSQQAKLPSVKFSPLKNIVKSPKIDHKTVVKVLSHNKSPSITERFAVIDETRKNAALPEEKVAVYQLNYNIKISKGTIIATYCRSKPHPR